MERVHHGIKSEVCVDGLVLRRGVAEQHVQFCKVGAREEEATVTHGLEEGQPQRSQGLPPSRLDLPRGPERQIILLICFTIAVEVTPGIPQA